MKRMLVTHSESHPRDLDVIEKEFGEFDIDDLEVPAGGLVVDATDELIDALEGRDVLFLRPGHINEEVIAAADSLKIIALTASGYDHVNVEAATDHGVLVIHTPENNAPSVVEHTFGFIFSLLRELPSTFDQVADGKWSQAREQVLDIRHMTVGVVGLGTIGFDVAKTASQFDADVIGYDPYVTEDLESSVFPRYDRETIEEAGVELVAELSELCSRADVITLHVPRTDRTEKMIDADVLDHADGSYLLNTGRGPVISETAVLDALEDGRLSGVALDVMENEPPETDNPLLSHPDVYVTPHVAATVRNRPPELPIGRTAEKIRTALSGELPDTAVNPTVFADWD